MSESLDGMLNREILALVRKVVPKVQHRDARVSSAGGEYWEFHYKNFSWYGLASGIYDARAKGWQGYLDFLSVNKP